MASRLRTDARVFVGAAIAVALVFAERPRVAAQAAPSPPADLLERVSRYVEAYYSRAQSLMVEETVMVQPIKSDLGPDGFARFLTYDLRFEWNPGDGTEKPRVDVVRELLRAN